MWLQILGSNLILEEIEFWVIHGWSEFETGANLISARIWIWMNWRTKIWVRHELSLLQIWVWPNVSFEVIRHMSPWHSSLGEQAGQTEQVGRAGRQLSQAKSFTIINWKETFMWPMNHHEQPWQLKFHSMTQIKNGVFYCGFTRFLNFASNIDLASLNPRPSNCWFYTSCITYVVWAGAMGSITLNQKSWYYISFILFFWILNEAGDTFWPGKFKPLRSSVGNRGTRLLY